MILRFKKEIEHLRRNKIINRFPKEDEGWVDSIWYDSSIKYTKGKSAGAIEKNIINFIELKGFHAESIKNMGREIVTKDIPTSLGTIKGKRKWIPSTGKKGTADISVIVYGQSVKIEVKKGKDIQSPTQKKYEADVTRVGVDGIYFIAHDEDDFLVKWKELMNHPRIKLLSTM